MPADFTACARGLGQRAHVVFVRLRGEVRIFALAVQRILGDGGREKPALAVDDRDADAEGAEIYSCYDGHVIPIVHHRGHRGTQGNSSVKLCVLCGAAKASRIRIYA